MSLVTTTLLSVDRVTTELLTKLPASGGGPANAITFIDGEILTFIGGETLTFIGD